MPNTCDGCELSHCSKCGHHVLGYLEPGQLCQSCQEEEDREEYRHYLVNHFVRLYHQHGNRLYDNG